MDKEKRKIKEVKEISKILDDIEPRKKKIMQGLIERVAFIKVEIEDLEADIQQNGWYEPFQQTNKCDPYDRARPAGQTYISLCASYQKYVKQLCDALPEDEQQNAAAELMNFLNNK